jgi:hypothetical protein
MPAASIIDRKWNRHTRHCLVISEDMFTPSQHSRRLAIAILSYIVMTFWCRFLLQFCLQKWHVSVTRMYQCIHHDCAMPAHSNPTRRCSLQPPSFQMQQIGSHLIYSRVWIYAGLPLTLIPVSCACIRLSSDLCGHYFQTSNDSFLSCLK